MLYNFVLVLVRQNFKIVGLLIARSLLVIVVNHDILYFDPII